MHTELTLTIETKLEPSGDLYSHLEALASFYTHLERKLFNDLVRQGISNEARNRLKRHYIAQYHIHARLFNALYTSVKGMITLQQQQHKQQQKVWKKQVRVLQQKLSKVAKWLKQGYKKSKKNPLKPHERCHYQTNIYLWHQKIERLKRKLQRPLTLSCVFGSRTFYKKQWTDETYQEDHAGWAQEWRRRRGCHFEFIGSKDERAGNQLCQYTQADDGQAFLHIRLPYGFERTHLKLPVRFCSVRETTNQNYYAYFHEAVERGVALFYRFLKRENGSWYVQVSFSLPREVISPQNGSIGIDVNYGLLAATTVNRHGNFVGFQQFRFEPEGKTSEQLRALLSGFVNRLVAQAKQQRKGMAIENLDLENKKVEDRGTRYNRKLHLLSYGLFRELLISRCKKAGVLLKQVNPAYSSIIGKYKYAQFFGISTHVAAAFVIARRAMFFKEKIPSILACVLHRGEAAKWEPIFRHKHHWSAWRFLHQHLATCLNVFNSWNGCSSSEEDRSAISVNTLMARCNRTQLSFLGTS